jgi:hypothetical protein
VRSKQAYSLIKLKFVLLVVPGKSVYETILTINIEQSKPKLDEKEVFTLVPNPEILDELKPPVEGVSASCSSIFFL